MSVIESVKARVKFNLPLFSSVSSPLAVDVTFIVNGVRVVKLPPLLMVVMVSPLSVCSFVCFRFCIPWCWVSFAGALHRGLCRSVSFCHLFCLVFTEEPSFIIVDKASNYSHFFIENFFLRLYSPSVIHYNHLHYNQIIVDKAGDPSRKLKHSKVRYV